MFLIFLNAQRGSLSKAAVPVAVLLFHHREAGVILCPCPPPTEQLEIISHMQEGVVTNFSLGTELALLLP